MEVYKNKFITYSQMNANTISGDPWSRRFRQQVPQWVQWESERETIRLVQNDGAVDRPKFIVGQEWPQIIGKRKLESSKPFYNRALHFWKVLLKANFNLINFLSGPAVSGKSLVWKWIGCKKDIERMVVGRKKPGFQNLKRIELRNALRSAGDVNKLLGKTVAWRVVLREWSVAIYCRRKFVPLYYSDCCIKNSLRTSQ